MKDIEISKLCLRDTPSVFAGGAVYPIDYERLYKIHKKMGFFVTRAKTNMACKRLHCRHVYKVCGLRCDQNV